LSSPTAQATTAVEAAEREAEALLGAAGAAVGALGIIDLLLGVAMFGFAGGQPPTAEGDVLAAGMRTYGFRVAVVGAVNLAFVWAAFTERGARPAWLALPLALVLGDLAFDALAFGQGSVPTRALLLASTLHVLLAAGVGAAAISALRRRAGTRAG